MVTSNFPTVYAVRTNHGVAARPQFTFISRTKVQVYRFKTRNEMYSRLNDEAHSFAAIALEPK